MGRARYETRPSVWLPWPLVDMSREPRGDERQGPRILGRRGPMKETIEKHALMITTRASYNSFSAGDIYVTVGSVTWSMWVTVFQSANTRM